MYIVSWLSSWLPHSGALCRDFAVDFVNTKLHLVILGLIQGGRMRLVGSDLVSCIVHPVLGFISAFWRLPFGFGPHLVGLDLIFWFRP